MDELEEPKLSYERVLNDLSTIIQTDSITSACLHSKFIVVGTLYGRIHIFDHLGNKVKGQDLCVHLKPVNHISIDAKGEYLVSCSRDRLVIYGLCDSEHNFVLMPDKPINVVAVDPAFHQAGSGRRFVAGDDKVTLYERGFLARYKSTILQSKEQKVRNISWHGQFIAWATDYFVQIFDIEQRSIITRIKRDCDIDTRDVCQFSWKDSRTLLIGWSNTVKICSIKERSQEVMNETQLRELPKKYVEIISMFETDFTVVGLAQFGNNLLALSFNSLSEKPQIQILETMSNTYNEVSRDLLTMRANSSGSTDSPESNTSKQTMTPSTKKFAYQLLSIHDEGIYFIICDKDVIFAKPRDYDDHFEWLVEHGQLNNCYTFAREHSNELVRHSLREIEELYMDELISTGTQDGFSEAAKLCSSICGTDQEKWDEALRKFCDANQLKQLLPYLPRCLRRESYDFVLDEFLKNDSVSFFRAIQELPSALYTLKYVTNNVIRYLANDPKNLVLNEALAELYTRDGKFEDAVNIYLDYNDKSKIFSLIRNNNLITILESRIDRLMQIDSSETAQLLVENIESIPMRRVVERLERFKTQRYLVSYLHRLTLKDPDSCVDYHDLMVKLYAQYQRESLLNFLKLSTNYNLEDALRICKEANLIKEVVFLLSRMGDLRVALSYIIESQGDINEAIEFCKEHQDADLWQDLIVCSMNNPEFISVLLKNIGTYISDPIDLIERIPADCEIDGLIPALVKILQDYQLQISLEKSCRDLMAKDCFSLLEKQIRCQTQGIAIREDQLCDHCNQPLLGENLVDNLSQTNKSGANAGATVGQSAEIAPDRAKMFLQQQQQQEQPDGGSPPVNLSTSNDLVVFGCHHVFHEECCADSDASSPSGPLDSDGPMMATKTCRVCMLEKDYDNQ